MSNVEKLKFYTELIQTIPLHTSILTYHKSTNKIKHIDANSSFNQFIKENIGSIEKFYSEISNNINNFINQKLINYKSQLIFNFGNLEKYYDIYFSLISETDEELIILIFLFNVTGYYFYSRENEFKILADVFNFFSNAILIVNVDNYQFKILKANAAITNLCGYEVSEIETQNLFDLPFWIDTKIIRIITDFLKSEKDFIKDIILKIKNKENKIITCGLIINCIRDKNRLPIRLHLMMSDITERINYRKQIAMKSAQLEVTNKIIKNMTHTITHKFSNYLSPVLTYINLWLERIEHDKINKNDLLRTFQVLKKILDELNLFIDSSIRLARYDAEIIDVEQIAMKKLFEKSVEILNEFATSKNVKFEINIPDTLTIYGNPFLVSEVIDNLLNNAVKYCNCDSKIICNYKILKNSYTWFSVESAGRPIPREYRSVIFKPYYRMPDAFDQQGDGLGLAICSTIIKHHKGKIGVIPKENYGNIFYFTLPHTAEFIMKEQEIDNEGEKINK